MEHFSDRASGNGEWFGYCDRQGNVTHPFKGGPYKVWPLEPFTFPCRPPCLLHDRLLAPCYPPWLPQGCFHAPRALLMCEAMLERLIADGALA